MQKITSPLHKDVWDISRCHSLNTLIYLIQSPPLSNPVLTGWLSQPGGQLAPGWSLSLHSYLRVLLPLPEKRFSLYPSGSLFLVPKSQMETSSQDRQVSLGFRSSHGLTPTTGGCRSLSPRPGAPPCPQGRGLSWTLCETMGLFGLFALFGSFP